MAKEQLSFRDADITDIPHLVTMLADDELGKTRERVGLPLDQRYLDAFQAMNQDPNHRLVVGEVAGEIVAMLQLSFLPGLSRLGAWRGQIESVRVATEHRSLGYGALAFRWAIEQCRKNDCNLVQLTSDITRTEAHRFYANLGFKATHTGYKLLLK
ncbi:GNAT family N-acetyltransferase [Alphaproteobacteria bacterium]|jgi:GNAT superfamily N-acetyltransferase|nr:GNAT family N-acetyltransferase [Alphaproteobacteria bacterium]